MFSAIDFKRQCKMVVMHPKEEIMSDNGIGDAFTGLPMYEIIGKLPDDLGEPKDKLPDQNIEQDLRNIDLNSDKSKNEKLSSYT